MSKSLDVILDETVVVAVAAGTDGRTLIRCGRCGRPAEAPSPRLGALVWAAVHDCPNRGEVLGELLAAMELDGVANVR